MAAKPVMRKVRLNELKTTFFVRTQLDQEHVLKLADLYAAGVELPPLKVTDGDEIVDGRHRKEAMELAFKPSHEAMVEIVEEESAAELIALALRSNEGGSKQPTRADIVHTLRLMIQERTSEKKIYELLTPNPYPKAVLRKYLETARAGLKRSAIQSAKEDVANGMTVRDSAEKHGIEVIDLKKAIAPSVGINQDRLKLTLREVSNRFFAMSRGNQALVKRLVIGYVDGDVNEKAAAAVLEKIDILAKRQLKQVEDWKMRFAAARKGQLINWKEISGAEDESDAA